MEEADASALRSAFATLDLLIITVITPESERILPAAELPGIVDGRPGRQRVLDLPHRVLLVLASVRRRPVDRSPAPAA